jgi:ubiquinone/menaquinone biosynthesis C-methylase UbiE
MSQYIFNNAAPQTALRFSSLEALYDPATIRYLERLGVAAGWQCLEVGGGSGSIAAWLAQRIAPTGHVLVTDIDPRYLTLTAGHESAHITIQRHDVGSEPLPEEGV